MSERESRVVELTDDQHRILMALSDPVGDELRLGPEARAAIAAALAEIHARRRREILARRRREILDAQA